MNAAANKALQSYLVSKEATPFFYVVGDGEYLEAKKTMIEMGMQVVKTSDFCADSDRAPRFDAIFDALRRGGGTRVLLGLGEYLALKGEETARRQLDILRNLQIENGGKAILLLRGVAGVVAALKARDPRFDGRRYWASERAECDIRVDLFEATIELNHCVNGIKNALATLEAGRDVERHIRGGERTVAVRTREDFSSSLCSVRRVASAFELVERFIPNGKTLVNCGDERNWARLVVELEKADNDFETMLRRRNLLDDWNIARLYETESDDFEGWLRFLAFKTKIDGKTRPYLRTALDKSSNLNELRKNIVRLIFNVDPKNAFFSDFYRERKELLERLKFDESEARNFIAENRREQELNTRIQRLTDLTLHERGEAIRLANEVKRDALSLVYPDLSDYLNSFYVENGVDSEYATEYFSDYKRQKVTGRVEATFLEKVKEVALSRVYNRFPARDSLVDEALRRSRANGETEEKVGLYCLDALGVEYLAFIAARCEREKIAFSVNVGRANLPTITACNKEFYDNWRGDARYKTNDRRLDKIKHEGGSVWLDAPTDAAVYLAEELETVADVVGKASELLKSKVLHRVVLTGDHGASRLAVLQARDGEKYESTTRGEHNGRCCLVAEDRQRQDFTNAVEENGRLILADYGRFKGSRAAIAETHGGATLEEALVPVVELTLHKEECLRVVVELKTTEVAVKFNKAPVVELFALQRINGDAYVEIEVGGTLKRYAASSDDGQHFSAELSDVKKKGEYSIRFGVGAEVLEKFDVRVVQGGVKKNAMLDDTIFLFKERR